MVGLWDFVHSPTHCSFSYPLFILLPTVHSPIHCSFSYPLFILLQIQARLTLLEAHQAELIEENEELQTSLAQRTQELHFLKTAGDNSSERIVNLENLLKDLQVKVTGRKTYLIVYTYLFISSYFSLSTMSLVSFIFACILLCPLLIFPSFFVSFPSSFLSFIFFSFNVPFFFTATFSIPTASVFIGISFHPASAFIGISFCAATRSLPLFAPYLFLPPNKQTNKQRQQQQTNKQTNKQTLEFACVCVRARVCACSSLCMPLCVY